MLLSLVPGGVAAAGVAAGGISMVMAPAPRDPGRVRRVCRLSDMDVGGQVTLADDNVLLLRDHNGLHAISLECTHLGCAVNRHQEGFQCHCHGSVFDEDGRPLVGPATRNLPWFAVTLHEGWVLVDLDRTVDTGTITAV